jgi:hypothetical protein
MKGIDPEKPLKEWAALEEKWLGKHPAITPEERQEMRTAALRLHPFKARTGC